MKFNHLNVPTHWQNYWTRYPEGHTILEALISWVSQVDDMVDNVNSWNEYLNNFVATFDKELQTEVTQTLSDWQNSGFLEVVVSEALQWQLTDYIATNEADKLSLETQFQQTMTDLRQRAINARTDYNLLGDGSDETDKLQLAINENIGKILFIPKQINDHYKIKPINIPSNTTIVLAEGTKIVGYDLLVDGFWRSERLFNIIDVENVVIKGNNSSVWLTGEYTQESNHIFNMDGCKNVYLYDITTYDSGGDGFFVSDEFSHGHTVPSNINLINCVSERSRRQGLSIISCDGFYAENCHFNNTGGTAPECGVDIEPSFAYQLLKDIKFVNCSANNNKVDGFRIDLHKLNATSEDVSIELINFNSSNNGYGFMNRDFYGVKGVIKLTNCNTESNKYAGFVELSNDVNAIKTIYNSCVSKNDHTGGTQSNTWQYSGGSSFAIQDKKENQVIGNSYFINCFAIDDRAVKLTNQSILIYPRLAGSSVDKVVFENLVTSEGINYLRVYPDPLTGTKKINIRIIENHGPLRQINVPVNLGSYRQLRVEETNSVLTNKGSTGVIRMRLIRGGDLLVFRFRVEENQNLLIDSTIFNINGLDSGMVYQSNEIGSYLVLKGRSDGSYDITNMVGNWKKVTSPY